MYVERFELFLAANGVPDSRKVPLFLTVLGGSTYVLLHNLVAPNSPKDVDYSDLVTTLRAHFESKPLIIAQRFHFHRRDQQPGESIASYLTELRRLIGRDWIQHIRLDWANIYSLAVDTPTAKLAKLLDSYDAVFLEGLGTMTLITARLSLKEGAVPQFCCPYSVPFAIRESVERELDRLEAEGVLRKVDNSSPHPQMCQGSDRFWTKSIITRSISPISQLSWPHSINSYGRATLELDGRMESSVLGSKGECYENPQCWPISTGNCPYP